MLQEAKFRIQRQNTKDSKPMTYQPKEEHVLSTISSLAEASQQAH
jgi:hypothetical protein